MLLGETSRFQIFPEIKKKKTRGDSATSEEIVRADTARTRFQSRSLSTRMINSTQVKNTWRRREEEGGEGVAEDSIRDTDLSRS